MLPADLHKGLTAETLKSLLHYNPETGIFTRLATNNQNQVGAEAGWLNPKTGYVLIGIDGHRMMAHRVAWFYMTGEWPKNRVDHKNCNKSDNRWCNLRSATDSQNKANGRVYVTSKSKIKGVRLHETGRYQARLSIENGRYKHLGLFDTAQEAAEVYQRAAKELRGEFARFE